MKNGNSSNKNYKTCENFIISVYKTLDNNQPKLRSFINLFSKKRNTSRPLEMQKSLIDIIRDHTHLVDQLNKFLPEELKVPKISNDNGASSYSYEENDNLAIQNIFSQLKQRRPEKVQDIIDLVKEMQQNETENSVIMNRFNLLLEDEPEILKYFSLKLNEDTRRKSRDQNDFVIEQPINLPIYEQERSVPKIIKTKAKDLKKDRFKADNELVALQPTIPVQTALVPTAMKNEILFFNYLKNELREDHYDNLIKLLSLYTECILTAQELFLMTKDFLPLNDNYFNYFQEIILSRETSRRKATAFYKPLNEIEFKSKYNGIELINLSI